MPWSVTNGEIAGPMSGQPYEQMLTLLSEHLYLELPCTQVLYHANLSEEHV